MAATSHGSVLLKTGQIDAENDRSYLFLHPQEILVARKRDEIPAIFEKLEMVLQSGYYVAGFLAYEVGYHFEPAALHGGNSYLDPAVPLLWFGVYAEPLVLQESARGAVEHGGDEHCDAQTGNAAIDLSHSEYFKQIQRIREYIEAGDIYQANFSVVMRKPWRQGAAALFEKIMSNQNPPYGALLNIGPMQIISASPELFFRRKGLRILTRPMKGTAPRGHDNEEDARIASWLASDEKNRAENVMIVDLLRNDLGRVCRAGTVQTTDLFKVERYPILFQMTSTVAGELRPEIEYYDLFRGLFPCGSITGAPKIRAMQIIRELEKNTRGAAFGAIGFISPNQEAVFSVAIRTLLLRDDEFEMRVGSGIVYDSDPGEEYRECMLKAQFLSQKPPRFELIETMLWNGEFFLLDLHMQRLESSARYFDFVFDRENLRVRLNEIASSFSRDTRQRVRALLSKSGEISLASACITDFLDSVSLQVAAERTDSADTLLRHKTTRREAYDRALAEARACGFDDALFFNERGEATECAIHNILIAKDGRLITPPVQSGLLPGVFRQHLLSIDSRIREETVTEDQLLSADSIFVLNSVRRLRPVTSIEKDKITIWRDQKPELVHSLGLKLFHDTYNAT